MRSPTRSCSTTWSPTDGNYSALDPADVSVTNDNDDTAGFTVSAISGNTTESGTTATFTVVLDSEPTASVTIDVASDDATEGLVTDPLGTLTFTTGDWDTPQTVTVTGQDDTLADGDVDYSIVLDNVVSADGNYSALDPADVSVTNDNDEVAGITVEELGGNTITSETQTTQNFSVVLDFEPEGDVVIDLTNPDPGEIELDKSQLTFDSATWNTPQNVEVTGVDDAVLDGNQDVVITIAVDDALSVDPYDGVSETVTATNEDDESQQP